MTFTSENFLSYLNGQFKADFDRYFTTATSSDGVKYITGVAPHLDVKHPSCSLYNGSAAAETNAASQSLCHVPCVDPNASLEKDWYFAGIYTFLLLAQLSLRKHASHFFSVMKHSPYPCVEDVLTATDTPIVRMLEHAYQDPGSQKYHPYYHDMLDVVVPALLPHFDSFLDAEVSIYEKAAILQSFSNLFNKLLDELKKRD